MDATLYAKLSAVCEQMTQARVSIARLEQSADETRRWIEAHRQRTTVLEQGASSRFEAIETRADALDARVHDVSHHLKTNIERTGENRERIKALEASRSITVWVQAIMPVLLLLAAVAYKLDLPGLGK